MLLLQEERAHSNDVQGDKRRVKRMKDLGNGRRDGENSRGVTLSLLTMMVTMMMHFLLKGSDS